MPAEFTPVVKPLPTMQENFFVSGDESMGIVSNIFISIFLMILAMLITWLFLWSYQKDKQLFISILGVIAILFAVENIIIILVSMDKYDEISFKVAMGSNVLAGFMFFIVAILFFIRFFQSQRSSSSVLSSSYVPSNVQNYIDQ